jgi:Family of unknown function (DUF6049)
VTIDDVSPSTLPTKGPLQVTGTLTNTTSSQWTGLQAYLLTSSEPMTTEAELADARVSESDAFIGERLALAGQFVNLGDLDPGETESYVISLPVRQLEISGAPGVYWLGVQILGTQDGVRADGADGRARTFITKMPAKHPPSTQLSLLVPFRARMAHDSAGRLAASRVWSHAFGKHGRLGRLLAFTGSSGDFPATMVLDPALLDIASQLAHGNQGFDLAEAPDHPSPSSSPSQSSGGDADTGGASSNSTDGSTSSGDATSANATNSGSWLDDARSVAKAHDVLSLPYGDVDVAGAYASGYASTVAAARALTDAALKKLGVSHTPVVDPPDGAVPWSTLTNVEDSTPVLLRSSMVKSNHTRLDVAGGPALTRVDDLASGGGPAPSAPYSPLAIRQQVLAVAAVHALSHSSGEPLVVQLPNLWDPDSGWRRAHFFRGLQVPWLLGVPATSILHDTAAESVPAGSGRVIYPQDAAARQMPGAAYAAAERLASLGHTLDELLPNNHTLEQQLAGFAYLGASVQQRANRVGTVVRTDNLSASVESLMDKVSVSGPAFVTLSGEEGPFSVTVANGLDQPITVGVRATSSGIDRPHISEAKPITIPGGQHRTIPMQVKSTRIGVWPVTLEAVTNDGQPLGTSAQFKIRSSHVGRYIWAVLGAGTLILLVAIFFRIRRQVRRRQRSHGPLLDRPGSTA